MITFRRVFLTALLAAAATGVSGCSRSVLNYQIAESIGTLNQYENNEPVETPKMQAERELKESEAAVEAEREELIERAAALAEGYFYEEAIALLQNSEILEGDERAEKAAAEYQSAINNMYVYDGDIGHFCFTNLIVDTDLAFDGDSCAQTYQSTMITLDEFEGILNILYHSGYVLIDIHSLAEEDTSGRNVTLTAAQLKMPNGKRPIIFSVENLDYSSVRSGDGVAERLVLDSAGNVAAVYEDADGVERTGAYDVIPVLEQFIEEHPDFSYRGARGIIGLSGSNGIFGYQIEESSTTQYEANIATVKSIVAKLKEDGWIFASEGYGYNYIGDLSYDALEKDISEWFSVVGNIVGSCDTLMYPYGSEVDYTSEKGSYIISKGFRYLVGMLSDGDHLEVNSSYLRQTRRTVTGYVFENYPGNFSSYFAVASIIDAAR